MNLISFVILSLFFPFNVFCQVHPVSDGAFFRSDYFLVLMLTLLLLVIPVAGFLIQRTRRQARALHLAASKDREIAMFREQLYVNITHELRTPLSLIISPLEKLSEENPHPDIQTALFHARELLHRFNDILKWNKLEANAMTVSMQAGNTIEECGKVIERFRHTAFKKNVKLEFTPAKDELWSIMDFEKVETILSNLLMNAIKFTGEGGEVKVNAGNVEEQGKTFFRLTVSDNGRGISKELLPGIFERFNQIGREPAGMAGSGIGLALVKRLTDLLGGRIAVASEEGKGSVFTITLPCQNAGPADKRITSEEGTKYEKNAQRTDERPLILIVEDSHDLRAFITSALHSSYEILEASIAENGLLLAKENLPELVITDVMLPGGMNGINFCNELKTDGLTAHIPVLVLTARSGLDVRLDALDAKADAFLTKPFSVRELEMTLHNLLESRRMLRERFQKTLQFDWEDKREDTVVLDPFLETVLGNINKQLDNSGYGVEQLADSMKISRVQLFKKIKSLAGMPPADLLRTIRLEKAKRLLQSGGNNVSTTAYQTGFDDPNYFSKAFKKHFGVSPSDISREN